MLACIALAPALTLLARARIRLAFMALAPMMLVAMRLGLHQDLEVFPRFGNRVNQDIIAIWPLIPLRILLLVFSE